jgi:hypothetical protein
LQALKKSKELVNKYNNQNNFSSKSKPYVLCQNGDKKISIEKYKNKMY